MNALDELLGRHAFGCQQIAIDIMGHMRLQVMLNHIIVTHAQGLRHHVVDILALVDSLLYTDTDQTAQQKCNQSDDNGTHDDIDGDGRCVIMLSFRVEPFVVDLLQLSCLFQTGIFVIDGINEVLVITYQSQFAWWDICHLGHQILESELFQLPLNGHLSPEEIVVGASLYACQSILWRVVFNGKSRIRVCHQDTDGRIVIGLHDERIFCAQGTDPRQRLLVRTSDGDNTVEVQQIPGHDIGPLHVIEGERKNKVCFTALEGFRGHIPLLHQIAVRDLQTVEYDVKHLDVIAVRLAFVVAEFVGRELPVADDHEWMVFRVFMYLLGCHCLHCAMKHEKHNPHAHPSEYMIESSFHFLTSYL